VANLPLGLREGLVGGVGGAPSVEGLDDAGDEGEGAEDAARVDGGVVGDVVEDSAEDVVVLELEERSDSVLESDEAADCREVRWAMGDETRGG
jgi:hypothetical protein